jgi:O-antigen/teichoic acid export membrane protein
MTQPGLVFSNTRLTIYYALIILFSAGSLDWYFQAEEKFMFIFRRTLFTKIFLLTAVFLFVKNEGDFTKYVFITLTIYFMIAIASIAIVLKDVLRSYNLQQFQPILLIKKLAPFAGLGILAGFYINIDTIILGYYSDTTSIGYYTVANKIARMVIAVLVSTTIVFFARIVSIEKGQHQNSLQKIQQYSLSYLLHISLPAATLVWFFGIEMVTVLSGAAFMPATQLLPYFSFVIVVVALHDFFVIQVLLTHHQEKKVFWLMLIASILGLGLSLVLIKLYGMKGAVISVLSTECFVLAGSVWLSKGIFIFSPQIRRQFFSSLTIIPITYIIAILAKKFIHSPMIILVSGAVISFGIYCFFQLYIFRNVFFVEMKEKLQTYIKGI